MWIHLLVLGLIDGASGSAEPPTPPPVVQTTGAPGARPWVAYINGRRVVGNQWEIQRLLEEIAAEQAEQEVARDKKPKRVRVTVKPGTPVEPKQAPVPQTAVAEVQADMRQVYAIAYAKAKIKVEAEQEDELLLILM